jgi:hypothetical protein
MGAAENFEGSRGVSMHFLIRLMMLHAGSALLGSPSHGAEPIKFGALAFQPKPQMLAQW